MHAVPFRPRPAADGRSPTAFRTALSARHERRRHRSPSGSCAPFGGFGGAGSGRRSSTKARFEGWDRPDDDRSLDQIVVAADETGGNETQIERPVTGDERNGL